MSYCPGGRPAAKYSPDELVFSWRTRPMAVFLTVIPAPETTAPNGSRIVPVSEAVSCAKPRIGPMTNTPTIDHRTFIFLIVRPRVAESHAEEVHCWTEQLKLAAVSDRKNFGTDYFTVGVMTIFR